MAELKRDVKYINRDFSEFRTALINLAKNYFPDQINDFNESSPSTAFIEMASYVGDVLGFAADTNLMESMVSLADERINLYNLSQALGYKPKTVIPASVELEIFQLLPAIGQGQNTKPDFRYALQVKENMQVSTTETDATFFRTLDAVDFRFSSSFDPTVLTVYSIDNTGEIEYYLAKKKVKAVSGELQTRTFSFSDPKKYDKVTLPENNVTQIVKVTDSDLNVWYEVPYLAQDLVPISIPNIPFNDPVLSQYHSSVPYLLCFHQTERRFITRLRKDDRTEIQFGGGLSSEADEEIVPNPMNVGLGLPYFERVTDLSVDPGNFLYTRTYGTAPNNTILTIQYATANGISENVNANTITRIVSSEIIDPADTTDPTVLQTIRDSLVVNNPRPAFGGMNRKPLDSVRQEAMANFAAQNRAVTKEDYILRCYTLPSKYGSVCKSYIEQDTQLGRWNEDRVPNPYSLNLSILSYDGNKNFVAANEAIKENLRQYLRQYKLLSDAINIKDIFVINIGIEIEAIIQPEENSNEVLLKLIEKTIELFDNDKMQPNGPILISNITSQLDRIPGVQSIQNIKFVNLVDMNQGYSGNVYSIDNAIRGGILYPSVDCSIFEVRFPKRDIKARILDV